MTVSFSRTKLALMICTTMSLLAFQNCGGTKFAGTSDSSSTSPDPTGGTNTVEGGGSGTNTVAGGGGSTNTIGGGGSGTNTVVGGGGSTNTIGVGGSGTNTVVGGGGSTNTIGVGGSGTNTVVVGGNSTNTVAGSGSNSGSGNGSGSGTGSLGGSSGSGSSSMSCGNQILVNGSCVDFTCQSVVQLTSLAQLQQIPARSASGICYAYHIFNSIPYGPSSNTPKMDSSVISANHDISTPGNHSPYMMAHFQSAIQLLGPRVVKLAGALDATSPILVDNFLLYGIYPASVTNPSPMTYYTASGTSDSGIFVGQTHLGYVLFNAVSIPVTPFAQSGTSSIAPINLSTSVPTNVSTMLDIRAEDCGAVRQLSDVYLLFQ